MTSDGIGELRIMLKQARAVFHPFTQIPSQADASISQLLPEAHSKLVVGTSGLSVFHGAYRLFGDSTSSTGSGLAEWNEPENWRFAWGDRLDGFVLFGESAWGDQYAYRQQGNVLEPVVYLLEAVTMEAEPLAASFDQFLEEEFLPNAVEPYDVMTVGAVDRFGPIGFDQHWTYAPSLALGGPEALDNVVVLPAAIAMRFAGDLYSDLREDQDPSSVTTWIDDRMRQRLRLSYRA